MTRRSVDISLAQGRSAPALLETPPGEPAAAVLLLHCLGGADNASLARLTGAWSARGWAVLTLDCALASDGAALTPADAAAALQELARRYDTPIVLAGHSYGGLLAIANAHLIERVRALALIATPAGLGGYTKRHTPRPNTFSINGSELAVGDEAAAALSWERVEDMVEDLRRPLMLMHAPLDNVVDLANAAHLFTAAKHPKSFVALDSCDHVLSRQPEACHAAEVIGAWACRYVSEAPPEEAPHATEVVVAEAGEGHFRQHVIAGRHRLLADEPLAVGGDDTGASPYELLLAALGACTAMTVRMYARHKKIPLEHVSVALAHEKIHAAACEECETKDGKIDKIERVVTLEGDLDAETRQRLLEIANKCPVHRTLHSEVWVPTRLAD